MDAPPPPYSAKEQAVTKTIESIIADDSYDESTKQAMINSILDHKAFLTKMQNISLNDNLDPSLDQKTCQDDVTLKSDAIYSPEYIRLQPRQYRTVFPQNYIPPQTQTEAPRQKENKLTEPLTHEAYSIPTSPPTRQRIGRKTGKPAVPKANPNTHQGDLRRKPTITDLISTSIGGSDYKIPEMLSTQETLQTSFYEETSLTDLTWIPKIFTDPRLNVLNQFCMEYQAIKTMTKPITGITIPYGDNYRRVYEKLTTLAKLNETKFTVSDSLLESPSLLLLLFGDALRDDTKEIKVPVPRLPHCFEHDQLSLEKFKIIVDATFELNNKLKDKQGIISTTSVLYEH